ncbi:M24 family metallopeptidase [Granulicella sibirica]|uniref:Aminopeptidase YpdF (MP-, MA-, MS-, AP-, NP-specific) n=1 Tax=Granulicella sibirica TaxID=2479048 RepID=A0A4Q0T3M2_9BACT|nr:Xaa-Pro peptidase family protein [Granulicella sibirica]RXH57100.1 Aminopeptidase YpdF (MP-, MA-, MS-, AP-, NP- specific) [Granulicella sibirica]
MNLDSIQAALREQKLDGWLFYDHHGRDPLAYTILGFAAGHVTRRWFYLIPAHGEPKKLVHRIESGRLDSLPGARSVYSSWQELESGLATLLDGVTKIAMQYSPRNAIMYVSMVDAGTVEVLREMGKEIVSSADLVSQFEAVMTDEQIATHYVAQAKIDAILEEGWREMGRRVRGAGTDEFAMVEWLSQAMRRDGIVWEHGPNVSVGPNSADSHYEPTPESSRPIRRGDFVLIDIWGKVDRPDACFYDITWTGVVDREPTGREKKVFDVVRDARDAAIDLVRRRFASGLPVEGWEADDAARAVIRDAGFAEFFTHRTGHNIGPVLHGSGAHLDNLETHDVRRILPNTCFSVEPGLYFTGEFGVRNEVDMIARKGVAEVTGRVQRELVRI